MNLSITRSRESIWVWLFWGIGLYLLLEAGPFLIVGRVLKRTAGELAGPYLAFALPAAIIMPLIWWLRKWEEQGASPKRLARRWGLSVALWGVALTIAVFYSGLKLRFVDPQDAVVAFVPAVLFAVFVLYFSMYSMALTRISSRATGKLGNPCPK